MSINAVSVDLLPPDYRVGDTVCIVKLMRRTGGYFWLLTEEPPAVRRDETGELCVSNWLPIPDIEGFDTAPNINWAAIDDLSYRVVPIVRPAKQSQQETRRAIAIRESYRKKNRKAPKS